MGWNRTYNFRHTTRHRCSNYSVRLSIVQSFYVEIQSRWHQDDSAAPIFYHLVILIIALLLYCFFLYLHELWVWRKGRKCPRLGVLVPCFQKVNKEVLGRLFFLILNRPLRHKRSLSWTTAPDRLTVWYRIGHKCWH